MSKLKFLNTAVDNVTMQEAIIKIDQLIKNKRNSYVVTPNVDHIVRLERDMEFKKAYAEADLVLTDGMPLIWISKLLRTPIVEKVSGADLLPEVCKMASERGYSIFFLGAAPGIAQKAATNLKREYTNLNVCGCYSPILGFENNEDEIDKIIGLVNNKKPDILALALGTPKQEKFIYRYKNKIDARVSLNIGAAVDFQAGQIKRAPKWMQRCGLEWFYRLSKEPKRMFKRYILDDMNILRIVIKYRKSVGEI